MFPIKKIAIMNNDFKLKLIFSCRFEPNYTYSHSLTHYLYLPYGMGILTAFLRQHNYYVEQEDFSVRFNRRFKNMDLYYNIDRNEQEMLRFLRSGEAEDKLYLFIDKLLDSTSIEEFDAIGFSIFSSLHFIFALMLSKRIKQRTDTPIVFGGPFITLYGQLYPDILSFIDYMIVGDGRVPLLKLIEYLKKKITISEVPNLIYRDNGKLIVNPRQHYSIEDIPMPDFSGLPLKLYKNPCLKFPGYRIELPYQITRGCTNRCSFCVHKYIDDKLEFKSYDKVLSELSQMKERYKNNEFCFMDSAINNSYEYLEGLCDLFIKNKLDINWSVDVKVGNLDKHILKKMKKAGCFSLAFGIESGSDSILKRMHKGFTAERASRTLRDAAELGFKNFLCLIVGYPHETQEDIEQTTNFIIKNKKYIRYCNIYRFALTYASPIYYEPENYCVTNLTPLQPPFCFAFDESEGLKWEQKQKQQEDSQRQIIKVVHKNACFGWRLYIFSYYSIRLFRYIIGKIKKACSLT